MEERPPNTAEWYLFIKEHKNDNGDKTPLTIDYTDNTDKKRQIKEIKDRLEEKYFVKIVLNERI